MTVKFRVRDRFNTSVDSYWSSIFFDEEYNRRLYLEGLGFKSFEQLELREEPSGAKKRRFRTEPTSDAPGFVTKLIGDSLAYTETGEFDPTTKKWSYSVATSKMSEKINIEGTLWAEAEGDHCYRVADIEITVKIFGVGGQVEKFIEKTTRENYVKATDFTNRFIAEKGY